MRRMCLLRVVTAGVLLAIAMGACGQPKEIPEGSPAEEVEEPVENTEGVLPGVDETNYPLVDGSTANLPLLAKMYSEVCGVPMEKAETMVEVSGGTGAVWRGLQYGETELAVVYEAPENIKSEMAEGAGEEEWDRNYEIESVGRDGLVFLVNTKNPVDSLTQDQLISIYTGRITDWSEVGGDSGPIAAFQRNEESGSQTLFRKLLMRDIQPMVPPTELVQAGMGGLIDSVAAYDGTGGALGFSVYYYANLMYTNPDLKLLAVDGVEPSFASIQSGEYPLVNGFYTVLRKDTPEDAPARQLRDWLHTEQGRQAMIDMNYIPVG